MELQTSTDEAAAVIPAFSERQAMEWSLVLSSQGIESTILRPEDDKPWQLLVEPAELARGRDSIRQYRMEQRSWYWRYRMPVAGVLFHWGAIGWLFLFMLVFAMDDAGGGNLKQAGLADTGLINHGQWWRLFTATYLHGDVAHLAMNSSIMMIFGGLAMARFGVAWAWVAVCLAGAIGNLPALWVFPSLHRSLGASGMVMGALGMSAMHSLSLLRLSLRAYKPLLKSIMGAILLFILFGLDPNSDILAHSGGFIGGMVLGGLLVLAPSSWLRNTWIQVAALVGWAALFLITWSLALA
jgi:rhomboid protease GluP